ncbi:MAG: hydrogenase small subunit, partial [SAR324 cluster bacterium]|nr:hydrogenase small subunit [SAR324 cluster bacterium]
MIWSNDMFIKKEVGRRDFLTLSTKIATVLGLSPVLIPKISKALQVREKPAVIWLHFQDCGGCTGSLLGSEAPDLASVMLDVISLEYHETFFAAAGQQMEEQLQAAMKKYAGNYILVVEGSIPTGIEGNYCQIAGKTALTRLTEAAKECASIIAIGSCASWGGIPASRPNPTGAVGVNEIIKDKKIIHIPG